MSSFMRECDSGIWFNEEDPNDVAYNPKCCRNVYLDYALGKFDYIDYKFKYIEFNDYYDNYKEIFDEYDEYLYDDYDYDDYDYDYDADTELSS